MQYPRIKIKFVTKKTNFIFLLKGITCEIDLKQYAECVFVSGNVKLKNIFRDLQDGKVVCNDEMYDLLVSDNYRQFDAFVMDRAGIDNFWDILQQIFLFEYFLPQDKRKLTRKQIQNALGIQQARWSTDPANVDRDERILRPVRFVYYEDVVASPDSLMNVEICRLMRYKYYDERYRDQKNRSTYDLQDSLKKKVYNLLRKTVWYIFDDHDFLDTVTPKGFWFSIPGGHKREYNLYPLPESFNTLCDLMCFHNFDLVFGTFSGYSMLKYYLFQEKRPMNCHVTVKQR